MRSSSGTLTVVPCTSRVEVVSTELPALIGDVTVSVNAETSLSLLLRVRARLLVAGVVSLDHQREINSLASRSVNRVTGMVLK